MYCLHLLSGTHISHTHNSLNNHDAVKTIYLLFIILILFNFLHCLSTAAHVSVKDSAGVEAITIFHC